MAARGQRSTHRGVADVEDRELRNYVRRAVAKRLQKPLLLLRRQPDRQPRAGDDGLVALVDAPDPLRPRRVIPRGEHRKGPVAARDVVAEDRDVVLALPLLHLLRRAHREAQRELVDPEEEVAGVDAVLARVRFRRAHRVLRVP